MAAVTKERPGRYERISRAKVPLAAGVKAYKGAAAVLDISAAGPARGFYKPAVAAADLLSRGRFRETVDNTGGANGAKKVEIDFHRTFDVVWWNNSTVTPITAQDRGKFAYWEDDQTVTSDNTSASEAGRIFDVSDDGKLVAVEVLP